MQNQNNILVNAMDYWSIIKKYKKFIVLFVLFVSIVAVVASLLMQKMYKSEAVITPISNQKGGGLLSSLGQLSGGGSSSFGDMLSGLSGGNPQAVKIVAILKSRTLTENVIKKVNLMPVLFKKAWDTKKNAWKSGDPLKTPTMEEAVRLMSVRIKVVEDKKDGIIRIVGVFETPQLTAEVVNTYLNELQKFINANTFTVSKKNRIFIESQLTQKKKEMLEAGKDISRFYRDSQISSSVPLLDVDVNKDLVEIPSALDEGINYYSELRKDIDALSAKTDALAANIGGDSEGATIVRNVPQQVYLQYVTLRQQLLGKLNALLAQQYEMAKIDEVKEDLAFQVIDKAVPPVKRCKPVRSQICVIAFIGALFVSVFAAFLMEYFKRLKNLPDKTF